VKKFDFEFITQLLKRVTLFTSFQKGMSPRIILLV